MNDDSQEHVNAPRQRSRRRFPPFWRRVTNSALILITFATFGGTSVYAMTKASDAAQRAEVVAATSLRTNEQISQLRADVASLHEAVEHEDLHTHDHPCVCKEISKKPPNDIFISLGGDCTQQMLERLGAILGPRVVCHRD